MQEAKEAAKRKLKQMEMEKKEAARRTAAGGRRSVGGSDGYSSVEQRGMMADAPSFAPPVSTQGGAAASAATAAAPTIQMAAKAGQGMKLGKKTSRPI